MMYRVQSRMSSTPVATLGRDDPIGRIGIMYPHCTYRDGQDTHNPDQASSDEIYLCILTLPLSAADW